MRRIVALACLVVSCSATSNQKPVSVPDIEKLACQGVDPVTCVTNLVKLIEELSSLAASKRAALVRQRDAGSE